MRLMRPIALGTLLVLAMLAGPASAEETTAAKAPVPIRAGESDLTVRVEVVWELP